MKKLFAILFATALVLGFTGCAQSPQQKNAGLMTEMQNLKTKYIKQDRKPAGFGLGVSADEQIAYELADQNARADLAKQIDAQTKNLVKSFKDQASANGKADIMQHSQNTIITKVDVRLNGATLTDVKVEVSENGEYKVYGVMVLDMDLVDEFVNAVKENDKNLDEATEKQVRDLAEKAYAEVQ